MRDACHRVVSWPRRGRVVAAFLAASIHKDVEHDDSHCCKWIPGRGGRGRCGGGVVWWLGFLGVGSTRMSSMTIAIAASGSRAGAAVRDAVLGAELLGRGAIG